MSAVAVTHRAPGVEYFDLAPGFTGFRCPEYGARLSAGACAKRWRKADSKTPSVGDFFERCRGYQIGAAHAGVPNTVRSAMTRQPWLCCRCGRGSTKLISGRICPSDFNRAREVIKGRNAKGNVPIFATPVREMAINYSRDGGEPITWRVSQSADMAELALDILRRERGSIAFLPAPGEDLPPAKPGHSAVCMCSIKQRAPVRFRCVQLAEPIDGHTIGVIGADDPDYRPPVGPKRPNTRPRTIPKYAPKVTAWEEAWEVARQAIEEIEEEYGKMTKAQLARELEARGIPTARGGPWTLGKIERALKGAPRDRWARSARSLASAISRRPVVRLEPIDVLAARAEASMISALVEGLRGCLKSPIGVTVGSFQPRIDPRPDGETKIMSASCCGGDKTCPWNKFVTEVQADAKPRPMVFVKVMAPSPAEAHRLAVAHHAKLCQAATHAVKAGLVSSTEAARWDAILGHRGAALEASRPKGR